MKRFLELVALVFVGNYLLFANGLYILEEGSSMMNSSDVESKTNQTLDQNYCETCKWVAALLQHHLQIGKSDENILKTGSIMCKAMKIQTPAVCDSGVHLFGTEIVKIVRDVNMTAAEICSFLLDDLCQVPVEHPLHKWNISFPLNQKPKVQTIPLPNGNAPRLKVLHLSDTHLDPLYVVGSNANCAEPLCCREFDGQTNASMNAAGKWGDYKCDTPNHTFVHLLDHITQTHEDIDYIIWTGDLVPHDIWNQNNEDLMIIIEDSIRLVSEKFAGIQVFPAIGNHERAPANSFPAVEQDETISMLYNDLNTLWSRWLPVNTTRTLRQGAFYSAPVRPGLRIISLNMNVCYYLNFWLIQNSTDPIMELAWLINELQLAENANEKVHIIGHIPPGNVDCLRTWSHNYNEIIARYESTVTAQFFGHTHYDEFEVFYDPKNLSRATNIAYVGPSVTPYTDLNPAYRIYYIDGDHRDTTRLVTDHETWVLNLQEANLIDNPVWRKSYSARDAYSMQGLRPADWSELITNMKNNDELFDLYIKNYWRNSPFQPECLSACKKDILCQTRSGRSHDKFNLCHDLEVMEDKIDEMPEIPRENSNTDEETTKSAHTSHRLNIFFTWIFIFHIIIPFV